MSSRAACSVPLGRGTNIRAFCEPWGQEGLERRGVRNGKSRKQMEYPGLVKGSELE